MKKRKTLIQKAQRQLLAGEFIDDKFINELSTDVNWNTEKVQKVLADAFNNPTNSYDTLSKKFNELRAAIKIHNIINTKVENLKKKIKQKFISISDESTTEASKILDEIDILVDQLDYEVEQNTPLTVNMEQEKVDYKYIDNFGELQEGSQSWETITHMCSDYTDKDKKNTNRFTQEEIMKKYNLSQGERSVLKKKFRLVKKQDAVPPLISTYVIKKYGKEAASAYIEKWIDHSLTTSAIEGYKRALDRKKEGIIQQLYMIMHNTHGELINRQEFFQKYNKPFKVAKTSYKKYKNNYDIIASSDYHFGEDTASTSTHFENMILDIAHMDGKNAHIFFLGDMIENIVPGGMHLGQMGHMDLDGFRLMKYIADFISEQLTRLRKTTGKNIYFYCITGNHDRGSVEKALDPERQFVLMIYELIKSNVSQYKNIHVIFDSLAKDLEQEYVTRDFIDDPLLRLHYNHGDEGFNQKMMKDPFKLLGRNYHSEKDNIIMAGHWHFLNKTQTNLFGTLTQKEEKKMYGRKQGLKKKHYDNVYTITEERDTPQNIKTILVPGLTPPNSYARKRNLYSDPGYVHIRRNRYGLLDIHTNTIGNLPDQNRKHQQAIDSIKSSVSIDTKDYTSITQ